MVKSSSFMKKNISWTGASSLKGFNKRRRIRTSQHHFKMKSREVWLPNKQIHQKATSLTGNILTCSMSANTKKPFQTRTERNNVIFSLLLFFLSAFERSPQGNTLLNEFRRSILSKYRSTFVLIPRDDIHKHLPTIL